MKQALWTFSAVIITITFGQAQTSKRTDNDTIAINTMYQDWGKAMATKGAEGYASFFTADAVLLPPDSKAIVGRDSIKQWMQANLDSFTFQPTGFSRDEVRLGTGWAFFRVTISGTRKPKSGGSPVAVTSKYLDVLQKQSDGSWKFVYRMWNSIN